MPLSSTVGPAFGLRMMEMGDRVPKGSPGLSLALHLGCLHLLGPVRAGQAAGTAENGVLPVAEREGLSHKGQASLDPFPVCQSCFKALGVKRLGEEACPRRDSGCSRGGLAGGTPASLHQKSRPHTTQPGQAGGGARTSCALLSPSTRAPVTAGHSISQVTRRRCNRENVRRPRSVLLFFSDQLRIQQLGKTKKNLSYTYVSISILLTLSHQETLMIPSFQNKKNLLEDVNSLP